jgi:hypothetical protein
MYNNVYQSWIDAGLAQRRLEPVWMDGDGNIVDTENKAVGLKVDVDLVHPDEVIAGDEVGCNTNAKDKDRNKQRKTISLKSWGKTVIDHSNFDAHFTLFPLRTLSGKVVQYAVIFAFDATKVPLRLVTGLDLWKFDELLKKVNDEERNNLIKMIRNVDEDEIKDETKEYVSSQMGNGGLFHQGPTCHFRGRAIPCFIACSPNGSMTGEILAKVFAALDSTGVYESTRNEGRKPCALVDGHGSRFTLPFLEYVTNPDHPWQATHVLPHGTAVCQLGDTAEENGTYKMEISNAFEELCRLKKKFRLSDVIRQEDILPIVNRAVQKAWGRPATLRRASARLGWYPLNRNILTFPSVVATRRMPEQQEDLSDTAILPVAPLQLDLPDHLADDPAAIELQDQANAMLAHPILLANPRAIETIHAYMQDHHHVFVRANALARQNGGIAAALKHAQTNLTSGSNHRNGSSSLGPEQLEKKRSEKARADAKEAGKQQRKTNKTGQLHMQCNEAIKKLTEANGGSSKLKIPHLKVLISWKKNKNDGPLKTKKDELIVQFNQVKDRRENPYPIVAPATVAAAAGHLNDAADGNNSDDSDDEPAPTVAAFARRPNIATDGNNSDSDSDDEVDTTHFKSIMDDFDPESESE